MLHFFTVELFVPLGNIFDFMLPKRCTQCSGLGIALCLLDSVATNMAEVSKISHFVSAAMA